APKPQRGAALAAQGRARFLVSDRQRSVANLRFPKTGHLIGNRPVPTMDELPFKIVKMPGARDEVIARVDDQPSYQRKCLLVHGESTESLVNPSRNSDLKFLCCYQVRK